MTKKVDKNRGKMGVTYYIFIKIYDILNEEFITL